MPRYNAPFYALNRGEVSRRSMMRVDQERLAMSADTMVNWMPLTSGPMTLRPGTEYLGSTYSDKTCRILEFVYATDDAALLELTDYNMRVWVDSELVSRDSVTSTIQAFSSWTRSASTVASVTVDGSGNLVFKDVKQGGLSIAYGTMNCTSNHNKSHGLRIPVTFGGNLTFKIGTTQGDDDVFPETLLGTGTHSINFSPTTNTIYLQFESKDARPYTIAPITIESGGAMVIPAPWAEADLAYVRYDQSADIVFLACEGYQQYMIQRRAFNSWSVVKYEVDDGPFPGTSGDDTFRFTPNALRGEATITTNKQFFTPEMVGGLIRLYHLQQDTTEDLNVAETATTPIFVTGTAETTYWDPAGAGGTGSFASISSAERVFNISITGTWAGTIVLQRTFDPEGISDWVEIASYTSNQSTTYNVRLTNIQAYYRLFFKSYTSGTATCNLSTAGGGGAGVARIVAVNTGSVPHSATVHVIKPFFGCVTGATTRGSGSTTQWRLSQWDSNQGWPSSVAIHEGRLWWSGGARIWGSVSDNYYSFDLDFDGEAAPINRSIGKGPIQNTNFMMSLGRLVIGTDAGIISARSSSFDEPLTPTKFNLKYSNTQGTARLRPLAMDQRGIFVQGSGRRVYMIIFTTQSFDYATVDLTRLNTDIGIPGFNSLGIQRQLDTRLWMIRNDGQAAVFLFDEQDKAEAWFRIKAADDGFIENVAVLPGTLEDQVFLVIRRTVNGSTKRYVEKMSRLDQCNGISLNRLLDCHAVYEGSATTTLTGLNYLEGKTVSVWGATSADVSNSTGRDLGTYTVSGGQITVSTSVTKAVVGLPYTAQFVSSKLAYAAREGTPINHQKRVNKIGFVLDRTHYQGVRYGQYDMQTGTYTADDLPLIEDGVETDANKIWQYYDAQQFELNGAWDTDSRIYVEAASPRPATVLGFTIEMETSG